MLPARSLEYWYAALIQRRMKEALFLIVINVATPSAIINAGSIVTSQFTVRQFNEAIVVRKLTGKRSNRRN